MGDIYKVKTFLRIFAKYFQGFLMATLKCFHFNALQTTCSVVSPDGGGRCVIVDPGMTTASEQEKLCQYLSGAGLIPEAILLTHGHFDHIFGVAALLDRYAGLPVYMHPAERKNVRIAPSYACYIEGCDIRNDFPTVDIADGQTLSLAGLSIQVIATPGHAPGGVCYYFPEDGLLLSGDTLFAGAIGRSDLPGGDYDDLIRSVMDRIMVLPGDVEVIPGHGPATTIGREAMTNPFLVPFNEPDTSSRDDGDPLILERE